MGRKERYNDLFVKAIGLSSAKGLNAKVFRFILNGMPTTDMVYIFAGDCFFVGTERGGVIKNIHVIQDNTYSVLNTLLLRNIVTYLGKDSFEVLQ